MKSISRSAMLILACLIILTTVLAGNMTSAGRDEQLAPRTPHHHAPAATKPATPNQSESKKRPAPGQPEPGPTAASNTAASDAAVAAHSAGPETVACKLLTADIAAQLLGGNAKQSTASDTLSLQATDTAITSCAYTGTNGGAQLTIRAATSSLGASENATAFGSGRPAGAVLVQGYGQSAYWDPDAHQLNVLGDNNWYIITPGSNLQADAEAIAKLLSPGF